MFHKWAMDQQLRQSLRWTQLYEKPRKVFYDMHIAIGTSIYGKKKIREKSQNNTSRNVTGQGGKTGLGGGYALIRMFHDSSQSYFTKLIFVVFSRVKPSEIHWQKVWIA